MFSNVKKYFYTNTNEQLNIRHIFKPLYIVLSMLGLFPYSVKFSNNKRGLTIIKKSIYVNTICSISYLLLLLSFLVLHIQYVKDSISDSVMTRELLTQINYIVELVSFIIFCFAAYFCAFKNRCTYVKIINQIASNTDPPNMESTMKQFRFQMNMIMVLLLTALLLQVSVNFSRDDSFWKMILVSISFMLPQMMQFTVLAFYHVLILMLVILLKNIRIHLAKLSKEKIIVMDYFEKIENKVLTLQYVESLYEKALEAKRDINDAFQAPLLITTLQCFHSMVSEAHIIYHGLVVERNFSLHPIVNCSIWIIYQIIKIFIMSRTGNLLKQEVMKIGQALHSIPTDKHGIRLLLEIAYNCDKNIPLVRNFQIQHFSSMIMYQGDEITAYGLFSLDAALLSKIIAASAMYLTILVQFDRGNETT